MKIIKTIDELNAFNASIGKTSLGLVPTMGALHDGHLSLIKQAQKENDGVLVSIYVNPTQFDRASDLDAYPNQLAEDIKLLQNHQVEALFLPDYSLMYPDQYRYRLTENEFSLTLCGAHRPGHFDGVLTVVMKLLNLVNANSAYFGEKDFQQLHLIKKMAEAFFMPVTIKSCATVREHDGLAMSSRNIRLTSAQRALAPQLYAIISGEGSIQQKHQKLISLGFEVDYLEKVENRLIAAAFLGEVRLIDNVEMTGVNSGEMAA